MIMDRTKILSEFKNLPVSEIQRYGSSCLRAFCAEKKISHPAIIDLLDHLESMHFSQNLPEWDRLGALLELNGRGDEIPADLEEILIKNKATDLTALVDSVVEIGIVDLYGGRTNLPIEFLDRAMTILEKNKIQLPAPSA